MNSIRKRPRVPEDGGWALTLADMMTLLLCFFVLLLTMADFDKERYQAMTDVMAEAMGGSQAPSARIAGDAAKASGQIRSATESPAQNLFALQLELARLLARGVDPAGDDVKLRLGDGVVVIRLRGAAFFDSGSAVLTDRARSVLERLAPPLARAHYDLTVEGHTDDQPIHSAQFPSNWELSSARASAVARFLIDHGFEKARIRIMGLADTRPLAPNLDTAGNGLPKNRALNRRIEILVHPRHAPPGS